MRPPTTTKAGTHNTAAPMLCLMTPPHTHTHPHTHTPAAALHISPHPHPHTRPLQVQVPCWEEDPECSLLPSLAAAVEQVGSGSSSRSSRCGGSSGLMVGGPVGGFRGTRCGEVCRGILWFWFWEGCATVSLPPLLHAHRFLTGLCYCQPATATACSGFRAESSQDRVGCYCC